MVVHVLGHGLLDFYELLCGDKRRYKCVETHKQADAGRGLQAQAGEQRPAQQ